MFGPNTLNLGKSVATAAGLLARGRTCAWSQHIKTGESLSPEPEATLTTCCTLTDSGQGATYQQRRPQRRQESSPLWFSLGYLPCTLQASVKPLSPVRPGTDDVSAG